MNKLDMVVITVKKTKTELVANKPVFFTKNRAT